MAFLQAYETWLYEKQYKAAMEDLYSEDQVESLAQEDVSICQRALRLISSPHYELGMNIFTLINVVTVFSRVCTPGNNLEQVEPWVVGELSFNFLMLFETVGDIAIAGPMKAYMYHFRIWPETLC